jgi:nucleotide-binding universal stress UspA family protein
MMMSGPENGGMAHASAGAYKSALVCLDNSRDSNWGVDIGISLAGRLATRLCGCHVYAAMLHESRFSQMEFTLPAQYQNAPELKRQRDNHIVLISKGLRIIAESYIAAFEARCWDAGIGSSGKTMEGKNYLEIVKELAGGAYDLAILGALGLGATETGCIGSVCERVVRRARTDVLVVREGRGIDGKIVVAVDGSPDSVAGVRRAIALAKAFGVKLEAVSAYDPHFHYAAFRNIAGILSEEAGRLFRFKEQEMLHGEIIDKGLAKIYQGHLETAEEMAGGEGMAMETTLLVGKPYDRILSHIKEARPALLVMGKAGVHADETLDIGSNTQNCLRHAGCNTLIASQAPPAVRGPLA